MILSEKKVGDEFYMDGLSYPDNNPVKTVCTLVEYKGMNKYVVDTEDCLVLCNGDDKVYNIKTEIQVKCSAEQDWAWHYESE